MLVFILNYIYFFFSLCVVRLLTLNVLHADSILFCVSARAHAFTQRCYTHRTVFRSL